jgi:hypothetical protein
VIATVAEIVRSDWPSEVPLIVRASVSAGASADVVTTSVAVVPEAMLGVIVAVTPAGAPATASATFPANPPVRVMAIVASPPPPCRTVRSLGADSVKLAAIGGVCVGGGAVPLSPAQAGAAMVATPRRKRAA